MAMMVPTLLVAVLCCWSRAAAAQAAANTCAPGESGACELEGAYTDLMLHDLGRDLGEPISAGAYGGRRRDDLANLWRTPPLWGVADSAPYLHDGRASTLDEAIRLHGGEASWSTRRYDKLSDGERAELLAFLAAQRAPTSLDQPSSSQPREASGKASKSGM